MPTRLETDFAFSIGDIVTHKAHIATCLPGEAQPFFVMEMWAKQCHGGLQRFYLCRPVHRFPVTKFGPDGHSAGIDHKLIEISEPELAAFPEDARSSVIAEQEQKASADREAARAARRGEA